MVKADSFFETPKFSELLVPVSFSSISLLKMRSLSVLLVLSCLLITLGSAYIIPADIRNLRNTTCSCADPSLCNLVNVPDRPEVFVFQVDSSNWYYYDYDVVTTIAAFVSDIPADMVCYAHGKNVRVVGSAPYPREQLHNTSYLTDFINSMYLFITNNNLDGINFDFEDPVNSTNGDAAALTQVVSQTTEALKNALGNDLQVSIDVAWSPNNIDGRAYEYANLINSVDLGFIMAYDMRSQVFPPNPCIASANSPFPLVMEGLLNFTAPPPQGLGLDPNKLILGIPWYGYVYTCINNPDPAINICPIEYVPFRGVNCSDAAGYEMCYSDVLNLLRNNATRGYTWNETLAAPYFDYVDSTTGAVHQVWFDDPRSLSLKYQYAKVEGYRGVGMWNVDCVAYGSAPNPDTELMWSTLASFLN